MKCETIRTITVGKHLFEISLFGQINYGQFLDCQTVKSYFANSQIDRVTFMSTGMTKIIGNWRRAYCSLSEIDKGIEQRRANIIGRVNMIEIRSRFHKGRLTNLSNTNTIKRRSRHTQDKTRATDSRSGAFQAR